MSARLVLRPSNCWDSYDKLTLIPHIMCMCVCMCVFVCVVFVSRSWRCQPQLSRSRVKLFWNSTLYIRDRNQYARYAVHDVMCVYPIYTCTTKASYGHT